MANAVPMEHALIYGITNHYNKVSVILGLPAVVVAITMGINKLDNYNTKTSL